jgi:glycosyltransferase involved in cell wall biosynthesis
MNPYKQYKYTQEPITYSVVMPVYNQESILVPNVQSVLDCTQCSFELIVILDYCFDNSERNLLAFVESLNPPSALVQITVFKTEYPLFETKCDNIGFRFATGTYCLEIQADMKMVEPGYNLHLVKPFLQYDNIIAVSGRCAHNLFTGEGIGKLGAAVERPLAELGISKNSFYVFETCNRGPLLLDRSKLAELQFLDEENYFLDDSDHDLMARAYLTKGYLCGYVPIEFESPLQHGSMRNHNSYQFCKEFQINQNEKMRLQRRPTQGLEKYQATWIRRQPLVLALADTVATDRNAPLQ